MKKIVLIALLGTLATCQAATESRVYEKDVKTPSFSPDQPLLFYGKQVYVYVTEENTHCTFAMYQDHGQTKEVRWYQAEAGVILQTLSHPPQKLMKEKKVDTFGDLLTFLTEKNAYLSPLQIVGIANECCLKAGEVETFFAKHIRECSSHSHHTSRSTLAP